MPLSLNNRSDIVADSTSIIKGNNTVDLIESLDAVTGLAPATLNSLEKLATALNNDAGFFTTVTTALGSKADSSTVTAALSNKADKSTTYTQTVTNQLLDAKVDDTEMTAYAKKTDVANSIAGLVGTAPLILDTLQEIASSINNDANFSTTMVNALAVKAPLASPALTGTATAVNLTVSGNLLKGTTNIIDELALKAPLAGPMAGRKQL